MISWLKKHISFPQPWLYKRADEHSWVYYSKNILTNCSVKDQEYQTKNINPHLPSGPVHPYQLEESISNFTDVCRTFSFLFYFEWIFLLANSEDSDQTPRSDLGLQFAYVPKDGTVNTYVLCFLLRLLSYRSSCRKRKSIRKAYMHKPSEINKQSERKDLLG